VDKNTLDQINEISLDLKLPAFRRDIETLIASALKENTSCEQVILELLKAEQEIRLINRKKAQMRNAGFPQLKYLQDLVRADLPADGISQLPTLETLDFVGAGLNVILGGSPGTGKTHIAIGLGIKACQQGRSVLFTTVSKLLTQIRECRSTRTLHSLELKFEKYDLVICDELGYVSFDKQGSEMLFNHISLRTGIKSTIITSNLSFDKWNDTFGKDPVLTAALLDRLTHKAYLVNMNGESYRMRETKKLRDVQKLKKGGK
jgi:DNA replication protein DnaC